MTFAPDGSFLRRAAGRGSIASDVVHWRAFEPRVNEAELSYTFRSEELTAETAVDEYQQVKRLPSGDLPGICTLTFRNLARDITPALPPRHAIDFDDEHYGHLHCCTDLPPTRDVMEALAALATQNGVIRDFVRAKKR